MTSQTKSIKRAMVLSGGGARGAYEVGVLAYLFEHFQGNVRHQPLFHILCGTSVGAIHASFLAAFAHAPDRELQYLINHWKSFRFEQLLRLSGWDLVRLPWDIRALLRQTSRQGILLRVEQLQDLVFRHIAWPNIASNIQSGQLEALTVSTTHIASGKTVLFVQQQAGQSAPRTRDYRQVTRSVNIGPEHAWASAAIPVLFPPVELDGCYYCDGGLRQNTPLSPALRLGADRVLVISVGHTRNSPVPEPGSHAKEPFPGPSLLLGKVLNALLLDHLDYDLTQLRGFNQLLNDGSVAFGPSFLEELSKSAKSIRGASYRHITPVVIRPSQDLGQLAGEFARSGALALRGTAAWLMDKIVEEDQMQHSDFLSYALFDGRLAHRLMALGREDARRCHGILEWFFSDSQQDPPADPTGVLR